MHNDNNWKGLPLSVCVGVCVGRGGGGESIDGMHGVCVQLATLQYFYTSMCLYMVYICV